MMAVKLQKCYSDGELYKLTLILYISINIVNNTRIFCGQDLVLCKNPNRPYSSSKLNPQPVVISHDPNKNLTPTLYTLNP